MESSDWQLTDNLDEFLHTAGDFLRSRPALHTVTLTVAEALRTRPFTYGAEPSLFGVLRGAGGPVRATLLHTPPRPVQLTPVDAPDAAALADRLAKAGHQVPGVWAERETATAFATAWQRCTGATAGQTERQRLYRLAEPVQPDRVPPGRARVAEAADRELLARWYTEFAADTGGQVVQDPAQWADSRVAHGGATLWETPDGTPVSLAGQLPESGGQIRVAPVYTPAALRGHGYAGAVTAEVSARAAATGAEVLLFTDLANPVSNRLYQRLGYRPVADFATWTFAAPAG
ncbi:putative GNAT family acetyltransferase [Streptomyces sp. BK022]|uniref:GNAT family N-acetyltransferase n=1 Tax=Streptomyces sp. BK022 TaxID=2512123 RepID=UPI0010299FBC|nr:GNAT family N-acetyltransferase [Streptomyces sp. BK022]RZU29326.1 putative GNAT family acetyltransferase [Streptomyces sp. BK022]